MLVLAGRAQRISRVSCDRHAGRVYARRAGQSWSHPALLRDLSSVGRAQGRLACGHRQRRTRVQRTRRDATLTEIPSRPHGRRRQRQPRLRYRDLHIARHVRRAHTTETPHDPAVNNRLLFPGHDQRPMGRRRRLCRRSPAPSGPCARRCACRQRRGRSSLRHDHPSPGQAARTARASSRRPQHPRAGHARRLQHHLARPRIAPRRAARHTSSSTPTTPRSPTRTSPTPVSPSACRSVLDPRERRCPNCTPKAPDHLT